jgi:hypothetical protein
MVTARTSRVTMLMIYAGTFLVSVLSFFTTYQGLAIFLDRPLAIIGSLGLQAAMLGIAWNLMRMKSNRMAYVLVFCCAASFSIFFSYVNFNIRLKETTRIEKARAAYAVAARPVVREYALQARQALTQSQYQFQRVADLLEMEETKGWATVVDEGSNDPYIQSIIDGARRTVVSWQDHQGYDYRQGSGRGIIANYLTSWQEQVQHNFSVMQAYVAEVDSVSMGIQSDVPVARQHELVNAASVKFPVSEYAAILGQTPRIPAPPQAENFVEQPANGQQALQLVIDDLQEMDRLTAFSLIFAIVVDLIVILMALGGSYATSDLDYVFKKVERDATRRIKKARMDDPRQLSESLRQNIECLRQASEYGRDLRRVMDEFETARARITLYRGEERASRIDPPLITSRFEVEDKEGIKPPKAS